MSVKPGYKEKFQKASERIEKFTLRERVIIVVTAVVAISLLWLQFVFDPMVRTEKKSRELIQQSDNEIVTLSSEQVILLEKVKQDPNIVLRRQQEQLTAQIEQQRMLLEEKLQGLIAPSKMVDVLKNVLSATNGLQLVTARNLPVQRFSTSSAKPSPGSAAEKNTEVDEDALPLYMHGLELVIDGDFYGVVEFLRKLESLEKGFQWSMLDYVVRKYPAARVTIRVQTISLDEQWIGV
jgi:MSHA biogenesis protein MshJ